MERCFSHRDDGAVACENVDKEIPMITSDIDMMMWHGPSKSGKSSLAFQYAFDLVRAAATQPMSTLPSASTVKLSEPLPYVILVCHESMRNKLERFVPIDPCEACETPRKSGADAQHWERVHIKYLQNASQLGHFASSLHVLGGRPIAMIVDDFDLFFQDDSASNASLYRCVALLKETTEYMHRVHGMGQVVVTCTTAAYTKDERHRLRRWFPLLLELVPDSHPHTFAMQEELPAPPFSSSIAIRDWAAYMPHFPVPYRVLYLFEPNTRGQDGVFRFLHAG
ncbi:hypothetical protein H310_01628 [Aphanomyces invadans]|uniref:Uncharacterized protein n=1 Tax=Aphanomyces invadans TaxID=157072 RepID=A0A024US89_9STRA|nr:hypothetical protein H310_01628 [Aphanomyces invadans]ETW09204.1 hypothetical protein H310_01628 [Aphanomyces invadans]|eukprot:XP_008863009.1 hypothetical protein H310_01628 [Aphanomyces invadans]